MTEWSARGMVQVISKPPRLTKRQRFLLSFLGSAGTPVTGDELQKLVFLHTVEGRSSWYEFMPCMLGAYSYELEQDHNYLQKAVFKESEDARLDSHENQLSFWDVANSAPCSTPVEDILSIHAERGLDLAQLAHSADPYFEALRLNIASFLTDDKQELGDHQKSRYSVAGSPVFYTIGYEGRTVAGFMNELIRHGVRTIIDVRRNAYSRKPGFSGQRLESLACGVSIAYEHMPELGIESSQRAQLQTHDDYTALFTRYRADLPARRVALERLKESCAGSDAAALMCFEKDIETCHRNVLREHLEANGFIFGGDL